MRCVALIVLLIAGTSVAENSVKELSFGGESGNVLQVRLEPFDPLRTDPYRGQRRYDQVRTGPFWTTTFSSSDLIAETFTIKDAWLEDVDGNRQYLFAYNIEGEFQCGGKLYPIKARGLRSTNFRPDTARAQAIQRAIMLVADSIQGSQRRCTLEASTNPAPRRSPVDVYDELLKLKELVDKNILTEAEFEAVTSANIASATFVEDGLVEDNTGPWFRFDFISNNLVAGNAQHRKTDRVFLCCGSQTLS